MAKTRKLSEMKLDELGVAKQVLDAQMVALRTEARAIAALPENEQDRKRLQDLRMELQNLRMKKLDIQAEQDTRPQAALDPNAHTLGIGGIETNETVGNIGGN